MSPNKFLEKSLSDDLVILFLKTLQMNRIFATDLFLSFFLINF